MGYSLSGLLQELTSIGEELLKSVGGVQQLSAFKLRQIKALVLPVSIQKRS
jgi:hypothetical protein